ncbi:MAG TPA: ComF family protein [Clostridia bacterium]
MKIKDWFIKTFFPPNYKCIICEREIFNNPKYSICPECELEFNESFCSKCGAPMDNMSDFCQDCKEYKPHYTAARGALIFEGAAQKLVHGFKYGGKKYLYEPLGQIMSDYFDKLGWQIDLIVPAPMSPERLKERGYNQALLLAQVVAKNHNIPLRDDILFKIKNTPYQARLSRKERFEQVKSAFSSNADADLKNKSVLLIDDVMTTGATCDELSRLLLKQKAREAYVLVLAQPRKKIKGLY